MNKFTKSIYYSIVLVLFISLLVGCSSDQEETEDPPLDSSVEESMSNDSDDSNDNTDNNNEETENEESDNATESEKDHILSNYSPEEIEYARVWLQLGANQDIDAVDVTHIPAGTLLNPDEDDIDVSYPEDVIQLRGSRIVDGIATYSGNGDGTINLYEIPYRWYGGLSRPDDVSADDIREERENIIEDTEVIYIEPGDDEEVVNMIEKMHIDQ